MQDKHKVTLYLPPNLHRRLKIKSAVDVESMSAMVEKAILFYLQHPEVIEEIEEQSSTKTQGQTHQVYHCPDCRAPLVHRDGELISLRNQAGALIEEISSEISVEKVREKVIEGLSEDLGEGLNEQLGSGTQEEETLVPC